MQFKSFDWLSHHGMSQNTMFYKYGKRTRDILGAFYFCFLYYLGAFLIKQLFHSPLLDMK